MKNLLGSASSEEILLLENWLSESERNRVYYEHLGKLWKEVPPMEDENLINEDRSWESLRQKLLQQPKGLRMIRPLYKYAALLLLLVGVASIIFWVSRSKEPEAFQKVQQAQVKEQVTNDAPTKQRFETRDEAKELFLNDGSFVYLDQSSKLKYEQTSDQSKPRMAYLNGEAYFNVKPGKKPFRLYGEHIRVDVVGTIFGIKEHPEKERVEISVLEGEIVVYSEDRKEKVHIKADEFYHYDIKKQRFSKKRGKGFFHKFKKLGSKVKALFQRDSKK